MMSNFCVVFVRSLSPHHRASRLQ